MQIIDCRPDRSHSTNSQHGLVQEICARHILVFGSEVQQRISSLTVGVVCTGGLGLIIIEQLMRLFPQKLVFIDKDEIEISNLNRMTGATPIDARLRTRKVNLAARNILAFNPQQEITAIHGDFLERRNQEKFKECDFIFGASDSNAVRLVANRLCLAYGIPYLDCGAGANVHEKRLQAAGGQVIKILPDSSFCLHCGGIFNMEEDMSEFLAEGERVRQENQGYIRGTHIPDPQVYSLNMMVASTAVWMFMRMVSGKDLDFDGVTINAKDFDTYPWKVRARENNGCPTCGRDGIIFAGDKAGLLYKDESEKRTPVIDLIGLEARQDLGRIVENSAFEFYFPFYRGIVLGDETNGLLLYAVK